MNIKTKLIPITWLPTMRHGYACGYIGIPPEHPWYNKGYDEVNQEVSIHGGLTFASSNEPHGIDVPVANTDNTWWLGFDTAHFGDDLNTCSKEYCEQELESLKQQALAVSYQP